MAENKHNQNFAINLFGEGTETPPFSCQVGIVSSGDILNRAAFTVNSSHEDNGVIERQVRCPASDSGIEFRCGFRTFSKYPAAAEWTLHLRNNSDAESPLISNVNALDLKLDSELAEPILHYARGATCCMDDFQPLKRALNKGASVDIQPGGGRSSSDFLPYFNLRLGPAHGVIFGIGWSGEWRARFDRGDDGQVRIRIGQAYLRLSLHPSEEIRTPMVLVLPYTGTVADGQNVLRRLILDHHRPHCAGVPLDLSVYSGNWGGTAAADHLANIDELASHCVPVDYYWIDAEWFGKGSWLQTAGDWRPKSDLYPSGFLPIANRLHSNKRRFLLWFEPERVCPGTLWSTELKDWLLEIPKEARSYNWGRSQNEPEWTQWESQRNQIQDGDQLLDLGKPAACKFLTEFIAEQITKYGIDCYRHDANIAPLAFWRHADPPNREGITEIRWVEGLYSFWDGLLKRFPNLMIDNCASGGRRLDLEAISRSAPLWRTDSPGNAVGRQCHTYGLASWVPLNATGGVNAGRDSDYALRSAWSAGLVTGLFAIGDTAQGGPPPPDFPYSRAVSTLSQYRQAKHFFLGDYYPLSTYSQADDAWMSWQFHLPDTGEGMVQSFRRENSPHSQATYALSGLDAEATYEVTDLDSKNVQTFKGQELMGKGLTIRIESRPAAAVIFYHVKGRYKKGKVDEIQQ